MRDTYMSLPFQRLHAVNLYEFVQKNLSQCPDYLALNVRHHPGIWVIFSSQGKSYLFPRIIDVVRV